MSMEKPRQVKEARLKDNFEALSNMGRKGAKMKALNKKNEEMKVTEHLQQEASMLRFEDGDVLPPDPDA